jgi:hypothetical protein
MDREREREREEKWMEDRRTESLVALAKKKDPKNQRKARRFLWLSIFT